MLSGAPAQAPERPRAPTTPHANDAMPIFTQRSEMPVSAQEAFAWHARPGAFERLVPPWRPLRVLERSGGIAPDAWVRLKLRLGPLPLVWEARHGALEPGRSFTDAQLRGPFRHWQHAHHFLPQGAGACILEDVVDYGLPLPPLGPLLAGGAVGRELTRLFRLRHARTARDLARHAPYAQRPPLTIAVTGASGLVGTRLCAFLTAGGHRVLRLVRRPVRQSGAGVDEIAWNPAAGLLDGAALEGVDAVVHLAGANIAGGLWTAARKRALWESRVQGTALLGTTLAGLQRPPRVLVSSSAIGFYGDRGDEPVDEDAPRGGGFLAELCEAWEQATAPAQAAGIRVVQVRTGLALAGEGGVLARLALPFALGLGGRLGAGHQRMSWIALEDLLGVFLAAIQQEHWHGAVNAVAPEAPTNREFTAALARVLHRPAVLPVPAAALRLALGQLAREALLAGQRVVPGKLAAAGFSWRLARLEEALAEELGREAPR